MLENPEPNTASSVYSISSFSSGLTVRALCGEGSYQSYDDFRASILVPPAALTTQSPGEPSKPLELGHVPSAPHHRRVNTEIIPRQHPLPSDHPAIDQSRTSKDRDKKRHSSHTRAQSLSTRLEVGGRALVNWFQGKREPVSLRLFGPTPATMASAHDSITERRSSRDLSELAVRPVPLSRLQKRMTPPSPLKQVTTPTRFSFFGSKKQDEKETELPEPADDELLNLDITEALFPSGSDQLSGEEAFEQLQANAENIIRRLQAAYKQRTFALHEALAEKSEQQEELEEARTRVQHIKSQLDDMAEKVLEKDRAMKAMAEELEQERQARKREEETRRRSVVLVKSPDSESITDLGNDLPTPKRHSKRASNATFNSDSGFESGDESSAESIFSRRNETLDSPVTVASPSITLPVPHKQPPATQAPRKDKPLPPPPQRQSTYDRIFTGLTGAFIRGNSKCSNCYGVPASEAWSVVGVLKEENTGLKARIGELEDVIDDCLGIVGP